MTCRSVYWPLRAVALVVAVAIIGLCGCRSSLRSADGGYASVKSGFVPVSHGGRLYYEMSGSGTPVILLHGHSLDRRMWDDQFAVFSEHFLTVRPDFRGYGLSSSQSEDMPMTHADDVIALMDYLGLERAHVVGLSMGAFVAGDMLALYPHRLLSCTLASGGIRNSPGPHTPMDSAEAARRDTEIAALLSKGIDEYKREWLQTLMASGGSQRERMREPLARMIADWTAWQPLHKEVRLYYGREAWDSLRSHAPLNVPTLLVRGENELRGKDKTTPPREAQCLSDYTYVVLPDCGHMLNMDQPDVFNAVVLDFLRKSR